MRLNFDPRSKGRRYHRMPSKLPFHDLVNVILTSRMVVSEMVDNDNEWPLAVREEVITLLVVKITTTTELSGFFRYFPLEQFFPYLYLFTCFLYLFKLY